MCVHVSIHVHAHVDNYIIFIIHVHMYMCTCTLLQYYFSAYNVLSQLAVYVLDVSSVCANMAMGSW